MPAERARTRTTATITGAREGAVVAPLSVDHRRDKRAKDAVPPFERPSEGDPMKTTSETRRAFLETMGRYGAGTLLASAAIESARGYAANDTIAVGCIGTGGRCQTLMKSLAQVPTVRTVAVCAIYAPHLDKARTMADPQAAATRRYRELLERKDIDAVLIGAPDHWHVPMT